MGLLHRRVSFGKFLEELVAWSVCGQEEGLCTEYTFTLRLKVTIIVQFRVGNFKYALHNHLNAVSRRSWVFVHEEASCVNALIVTVLGPSCGVLSLACHLEMVHFVLSPVSRRSWVCVDFTCTDCLSSS